MQPGCCTKCNPVVVQSVVAISGPFCNGFNRILWKYDIVPPTWKFPCFPYSVYTLKSYKHLWNISVRIRTLSAHSLTRRGTCRHFNAQKTLVEAEYCNWNRSSPVWLGRPPRPLLGAASRTPRTPTGRRWTAGRRRPSSARPPKCQCPFKLKNHFFCMYSAEHTYPYKVEWIYRHQR